jgi:hypothetical protein
MERQFCWCIIIYLIIFINSIQSTYLFHLKQRNESTNKKQTSVLSSKKSSDNFMQHQSTLSTSLARATTTIQSSNTFQSLITKPNSYLYNPDEDDEILLNRVKRHPVPFVCKSK